MSGNHHLAKLDRISNLCCKKNLRWNDDTLFNKTVWLLYEVLDLIFMYIYLIMVKIGVCLFFSSIIYFTSMKHEACFLLYLFSFHFFCKENKKHGGEGSTIPSNFIWLMLSAIIYVIFSFAFGGWGQLIWILKIRKLVKIQVCSMLNLLF